MRLVFLGAPGVGKGTQAELIASRFHQPKISTGDILREAVRNKTALGLQAKARLDQGKLVPDEVVVGIVKEKLAEPMSAKGFILDGFPRTIRQAEDLDELLRSRGERLDRVVNFVVPLDAVVRRLTGRRSCSKCQAIFHVETNPPRRDGICDRCGGELVQRSDDKKETVEARLSVYEQQTAPLVDYYRQRDLLSELDGSGRIEAVHQRLMDLLSAKGLA
ncbi:MAG: adenylate kinase [Nitrospirae bacterium 13_2_20CM_2_62_8]|nr:MAG: adenylate kinase [Nitrospirae bacterium 13_2_20CM_2_62_8]